MIDQVPTLQELSVGRIVDGEVLSGANLSHAAGNLERFYIYSCPPEILVADLSGLKSVSLFEARDTELTLRGMPALHGISLGFVNSGTSLSSDDTTLAALSWLCYWQCDLDLLDVPVWVETMYIENIEDCAITGGENLKQLQIYEGSDLTFEDMPVLREIQCTSNFGGTLSLQDLPALQHFILMTEEGRWSPQVDFERVDNLRAIDAPWWRPNDEQVAAICRLPRLEHLVISRAFVSPAIIPVLMEVDTLRFLRYPRYMYNVGDTDYAQMRRDFPQPGIRIHGPATSAESGERWSPDP